MKKYILFIFILFSKSIFSAFYFSENTNNISTNTNSSTNIAITQEIINNMDVKNYTTNTSVRLEMEGTNIIMQSNLFVSKVAPVGGYRTSAFRYTEVTFFLTIAFAYTYAGLAVYGFNSIENNFILSIPLRAPYKKLGISSTAFEIFAGVACAVSVAYDSYQRIYGKKKDNSLSFNFMPFYNASNNDAGFYFALSYPYRF